MSSQGAINDSVAACVTSLQQPLSPAPQQSQFPSFPPAQHAPAASLSTSPWQRRPAGAAPQQLVVDAAAAPVDARTNTSSPSTAGAHSLCETSSSDAAPAPPAASAAGAGGGVRPAPAVDAAKAASLHQDAVFASSYYVGEESCSSSLPHSSRLSLSTVQQLESLSEAAASSPAATAGAAVGDFPPSSSTVLTACSVPGEATTAAVSADPAAAATTVQRTPVAGSRSVAAVHSSGVGAWSRQQQSCSEQPFPSTTNEGEVPTGAKPATVAAAEADAVAAGPSPLNSASAAASADAPATPPGQSSSSIFFGTACRAQDEFKHAAPASFLQPTQEQQQEKHTSFRSREVAHEAGAVSQATKRRRKSSSIPPHAAPEGSTCSSAGAPAETSSLRTTGVVEPAGATGRAAGFAGEGDAEDAGRARSENNRPEEKEEEEEEEKKKDTLGGGAVSTVSDGLLKRCRTGPEAAGKPRATFDALEHKQQRKTDDMRRETHRRRRITQRPQQSSSDIYEQTLASTVATLFISPSGLARIYNQPSDAAAAVAAAATNQQPHNTASCGPAEQHLPAATSFLAAHPQEAEPDDNCSRSVNSDRGDSHGSKTSGESVIDADNVKSSSWSAATTKDSQFSHLHRMEHLGYKEGSFFFDKRQFREMEIVGQFNRGFIIACHRTSLDEPQKQLHKMSQQQRPHLHASLQGNRLQGHQREQQGGSVRPTRESFAAASPSVPSLLPLHGGSVAAGSTHALDLPPAQGEKLALFIIDQHASDERRRFEELSQRYKPSTQPLLQPLPLVLPADMQQAAIEFQEELRQNGFHVCLRPSPPKRSPCVCQKRNASKPSHRTTPTVAVDGVNSTRAAAAATGAVPAGENSAAVGQPASSENAASDRGGDASGAEGVSGNALTDDATSAAAAATLSRSAAAADDRAAPAVEDTVQQQSGEEEQRLWMTSLPAVEGVQLKQADLVDFLGALLQDEDGRAAVARWRRQQRERRLRLRSRTKQGPPGGEDGGASEGTHSNTQQQQHQGEEESQQKGKEDATTAAAPTRSVARGFVRYAGNGDRGKEVAARPRGREGDSDEGSQSETQDSESEGEAEAEEELLHKHHRVLQCRPKRVWDVLASRACRSAVMVGDALSVQQMSNIVKRMSGLHMPFNCPHGRPTVRHLIDVSLPTTQADDQFPFAEAAEKQEEAESMTHCQPRGHGVWRSPRKQHRSRQPYPLQQETPVLRQQPAPQQRVQQTQPPHQQISPTLPDGRESEERQLLKLGRGREDQQCRQLSSLQHLGTQAMNSPSRHEGLRTQTQPVTCRNAEQSLRDTKEERRDEEDAGGLKGEHRSRRGQGECAYVNEQKPHTEEWYSLATLSAGRGKNADGTTASEETVTTQDTNVLRVYTWTEAAGKEDVAEFRAGSCEETGNGNPSSKPEETHFREDEWDTQATRAEEMGRGIRVYTLSFP